MDNYEQQLTAQLNTQPQLNVFDEAVNLARILNFYSFMRSKKWSGSICYYENSYSTWINTHGNGVYEGHGVTINEALDDILKSL